MRVLKDDPRLRKDLERCRQYQWVEVGVLELCFCARNHKHTGQERHLYYFNRNVFLNPEFLERLVAKYAKKGEVRVVEDLVL